MHLDTFFQLRKEASSRDQRVRLKAADDVGSQQISALKYIKSISRSASLGQRACAFTNVDFGAVEIFTIFSCGVFSLVSHALQRLSVHTRFLLVLIYVESV